MSRAIHWFRNDLRLRDNRGLETAVSRADRVIPVFVLDDRILASPRTGAPRVRFLLDCVQRLADDLAARGSRLIVRRGEPRRVVPGLVDELSADLVTCNADVTPYARARDRAVRAAVEKRGARMIEEKDRVCFSAGEVSTADGRPFSVYTPYRRAWLRAFREDPQEPHRAPRLPPSHATLPSDPVPDAEALGFAGDETEIPTGGEDAAQRRLASFLEKRAADYRRDRDRPAVDGTSRLSPYLRFGAISVRDCIAKAREASAEDARLAEGVGGWIDELVWREFYSAILETHPHVRDRSYREQYEALEWNDDEEGFRAWCEGRTGFPFVDAGMRQLDRTGWMHNRVRMVVASFLTKDLLVDWRRGEEHFFRKLVDGDPASNNGGWQWAASTGTDAQPYFRIFNPVSQSKRYDPDGEYIRRFVPELADQPTALVHEPWDEPLTTRDYPARIVDHAERREIALERFAAARG